MDIQDVPENNDNLRLEDDSDTGHFVSVESVPDKFRSVFANYACFNKIQSAIFNDVFQTDASLVVSAPTGSGKTVVFELAICKLIKKYDLHGLDYNFMIIYVAPIKALCEERVMDWHKKFSPLGVNCVSVTGDSDVVSVQHLTNHNLIITTPEKWDSLTRRWRNNIGFMNRVALFMIDEVHLLNDEQRGPTLEAIMSRMKTIEDSKKENLSAELHQTIRFLAISATIPNVEDIAEWVGTSAMPAKYFNFSDEERPVKLTKIVMGYYYNAQMSTPFKFDIMLNYKLQGIILQYSNGKPTLIFCSTRKSVEMTTKYLSQNLTITLNGSQKAILQQAASQITTPAVKEILIHGIGSHHAGMLPESRRIMETLFRNGDLPILVTTSTLAMGINLPAHLVIIKSTKYYTKGEYRDYSESVLFQMIGRAGRPQYDTFATAVILTTTVDKAKFDNMLGGTQNVESSLHKNLTEHLNAEIVLRTITDREVAKQWLASTYLHIRARKHPTYYGFSANLNQEQLNRKLMEMCEIDINKLERVGMIEIADSNINPTQMGSLMAKYCVHFETMKLFKQIQGTEILQQILGLISKSHEFSDLYLRVNDKKTLNLLNKCKNRETIRFPFNGKIKTLDMKVNCIIQAVFGCLQILEPSLINEAQKIMRIGERLSKCLAEYIETRENGFSALLNTLILAKCFHCRIWENSPYVSRQLSGIGAVMSANLVLAGKDSFQSILETNARNLEMILHRKPPMGDSIITAVERLPKYIMRLEEEKLSSFKSKVKVFIQLVNAEKLEKEMTIDSQSFMDLVIGDECNNILLHKKFSHNFMIDNKEIETEVSKELTEPTTVMAHFISENWAGIDCTASLEVNAILLNANKAGNLPKKVISDTKKAKLAKKIDQPIMESGTRKPSVKNFINQYFKIMKKIKTPELSPPLSPILNNIREEFDENNLLEFEQDDLNSWEPLDEKILNSSAEQRFDNYITECENDANISNTVAGDSNFINENDIEVSLNKNSGITKKHNLSTNNVDTENNNVIEDSGRENCFSKNKSHGLDSNYKINSGTNLSDNHFKNNFNKNEKDQVIDSKNINEATSDLLSDSYEEEFGSDFCTQDLLKNDDSKKAEPKISIETKKRKFQFKKTNNNKENVPKKLESYEDVFSDEIVSELKLAENKGFNEKIDKPKKVNVLGVANDKNENANKKIVNIQSSKLKAKEVELSEKSALSSSAAPIIETLRGLVENKNNQIRKDGKNFKSNSEKEEEYKFSLEDSFTLTERENLDQQNRMNRNEGVIGKEEMNEYEEAMNKIKEYEEVTSVESDVENDYEKKYVSENKNKTGFDEKSNQLKNNYVIEKQEQFRKNQKGNSLNNSVFNEGTSKPRINSEQYQKNASLNNSTADEDSLKSSVSKVFSNSSINDEYNSKPNISKLKSLNEERINRRIEQPAYFNLQRRGGIQQKNLIQSADMNISNRQGNIVNDQFVNINIANLKQKIITNDSNQYIANRNGSFIKGSEHFINPTTNQFIPIERNPNVITCEAQSSNMINPNNSGFSYNRNQLIAKDENEAPFSTDISSISEGEEEFVDETEYQYLPEFPKPPQRAENFITDVGDLTPSTHSVSRNCSFQQRNLSFGEGSSRSYCGEEGVFGIPKAEPALESFSNLIQNRKRVIRNTMNFEKSIIEEKPELKKFAYIPKKKISHTITSNSQQEENLREIPPKRLKTNEFSDYSQGSNDKKSITWRSPLIVSPKVKYSPKNIQRGKFNLFSQRPEIHSTSEVLSTKSRSRTPMSQPSRISFAQSPFIPNPQTYQNSPQTPSQSLYPQRARAKLTRRRVTSGNFSLNTPKNLHKLPVTDQDCGYSQSTQHSQLAQQRCNELNDFFSNTQIDVFKPEMNFIENDLTNYVKQNQPAVDIKQENIEPQEWFNGPDSTEQQLKDELKRELCERIKQSNSQTDFIPCEELPYINPNLSFLNNQSQIDLYNPYNYQPPNIINPNLGVNQPLMYGNYPNPMYENYPSTYQHPQTWEYEQQQMRWNEMNRARMIPQTSQRTGYNMENRWDLMQRYLQTQAHQTNFTDK